MPGYALAEILQQLGKRAAVLCNDEIPPRYQFMLPEQPAAADFPPKCIIAVDVADAKLLGSRIQEQYGSRVDLCIDHHVSNVPYAKARLLDGTASAVCEILYRLCRVLPVQITDSIAVCLYTGMATDTGCFQYDNAGPGNPPCGGGIDGNMPRCAVCVDQPENVCSQELWQIAAG